MRWRIERDHQDLKPDFGLGHYEGRGWRGFHHYATLSITAYAFPMAERLKAGSSDASVSNDYVPRGRPALPAPRSGLDHHAAPGRGTRN